MKGAVIRYRRGTASDTQAAFALFRRALNDYMVRMGMPAGAGETTEDAWTQWQSMYGHLERTAAEFWVAENDEGRMAGFARSTERDGLMELTEFFVDPEIQASGVGRGLLQKAFPPGRGPDRSIIATMDATAVGLYLRFGVSVQSLGLYLWKAPEATSANSDLRFEPAVPGNSDEEILSLEKQVLGHRRSEDISWLLGDRPAVIYRRGGLAAGYGFESNARGQIGPIAALAASDMPAALAHMENAAFEMGLQEIGLTVPEVNRTAVGWLLRHGWRIFPFYTLLMASGPFMKLDRYVLCEPVAIL
ncbi:MAG: GNAT family N-acetyltransferase [Actinomycetota bacterium]